MFGAKSASANVTAKTVALGKTNDWLDSVLRLNLTRLTTQDR